MRPFIPPPKRTRGQVMVMACFTMLLLALMMLLSFNLANAIHERIRIQSHADAQAYSVAVIEARTYNTLAFSNRAIAAALVSQIGLHAWLAIASQTNAIHTAFAMSFVQIAGIEFCLCLCPCPKCVPPHCIDALIALNIARGHQQKAIEVAMKIQAEEQQFNTAVEKIGWMIEAIHMEQMAFVTNTMSQMSSQGDLLKRLQQNNAPASSYLDFADAMNLQEFGCTLEGMPGMPMGSCQGVQSTSTSDRGKIMQSVANGTRTAFTVSPNTERAMASINKDYIPMSPFLKGMQNNEGVHIFSFDIAAGTGSTYNRGPFAGEQLTTVGGASFGNLSVTKWRHATGGFPLMTAAFSDARSGLHMLPFTHSGTHGSFSGCDTQDCFVNFRASDNREDDFNQPSTYGAVKQDLRWTINGQRPWELNPQATVNVALGDVGNINVRLAPEGEGYAVAKGKAYFHQLDDWQVAPNAFDPFWRAKLHRFDNAQELTKLASGAGDPAVLPGAPVEGKR